LTNVVNILYQEHQEAVSNMNKPVIRGRNQLNIERAGVVNNTTNDNKTKSLLLEGGGGSNSNQSSLLN